MSHFRPALAICLQGGGLKEVVDEVEAVVAEGGGEGKVDEFRGSHASGPGPAESQIGEHACKLAGGWRTGAAMLAAETTASHLPPFFLRPTLSTWCLQGSVCTATWGSPHTEQTWG